MPDANDMDLVREFACNNSEVAFTELVRRHINLVYSVARRCTGTDSDAQDVTQAVFIILARKAGGLRGHAVLTGWLYETTRFTAARLLRTAARRRAREQETYMQSTLNEADTAAVWETLSPHLEAAMSRLAAADRRLLVLRFYENKSGAEAAALLGIREDAAHKRVARAIEKLRRIFAQRGMTLTAMAIVGAVSANSVQAAPAVLAKSITGVAMTGGVAASGTILSLAKGGTMKAMTWLKATTVAAILANAFMSQEIVATHFNFAGNPDYWMTQSSSTLVWLLTGCGFPLFFIAIGYFMRFLIGRRALNIPNREYWLAPERVDETSGYVFHLYLWLAFLGAIFMLMLMLLQIQANHQRPPHLSTPLALAVGGCFITATAVLIGKMFRHFSRVNKPCPQTDEQRKNSNES
jgi:RNA polymerase sigma factor (sigma-70 family)